MNEDEVTKPEGEMGDDDTTAMPEAPATEGAEGDEVVHPKVEEGEEDVSA
jgi:hypothetical protein